MESVLIVCSPIGSKWLEEATSTSFITCVNLNITRVIKQMVSYGICFNFLQCSMTFGMTWLDSLSTRLNFQSASNLSITLSLYNARWFEYPAEFSECSVAKYPLQLLECLAGWAPLSICKVIRSSNALFKVLNSLSINLHF